jgi:hypothetical protein
MSPTHGFELVLAGAAFFETNDAARVINEIAALMPKLSPTSYSSIAIDSLGAFSLRETHSSWSTALMLGALDYYGLKDIQALQIVPDQAHWTIDIPGMEKQWSAAAEPIWRWMHESWEYDVPAESVVVTNLSALRGARVTEAARWETTQWEMFAGAGPDVAPHDVRIVPLGTLLAVDDSPNAVVNLAVGQALWRDADEKEWHSWGNAAKSSDD